MKAISLLCGVVLLGLSTRADDWPQWRGPQRDGVWRERGIVESFPKEGLKVLWRAEAGGGWSSPVVAEGRAFLFDSKLQQPKAQERVRCFDATSGKVLWTYAYDVDYPDWAFGADQNSGPTSTPALADGKVYVLGVNSEATCLEAATGTVVWHKNLAEGHTLDSFKCRASPVIDGDRVILFRGITAPAGDKPAPCVVALDRHTGREIWTALQEPVTNSTPALITAGGRRQLIVWTDNAVTSLSPESGAILWQQPIKTSSNDDNPTPVWSGDRLLIGGLMMKLDADKPGASILWPKNSGPLKRTLSSISTPLIAGDAVYSLNNHGDFVCLDAQTGQELWRTDKVTARKTGPSAHLTPNGDAVFIFTDEGNLIRARLSPSGYEETSRTKVIEPVYFFGGHHLCWAPPAYAQRCIFVRNEHQILCASLAVP